MSVKDPLVISEDSPNILKSLITRFPQVMQINNNIIEDRPIESSVHFEEIPFLEPSDPLMQWLLEQMFGCELIKKNSERACGYEALQGGIQFERKCFTKAQNKELAVSRLKEVKAAVQTNQDKSLITAQYVGHVTPENRRKMADELDKISKKYIVESSSGTCSLLMNITIQET